MKRQPLPVDPAEEPASLFSKRLECCFPEKILACHFTAVADRASNFVATFARTWAIQRKPTLWRAWLRWVAGEARAKFSKR